MKATIEYDGTLRVEAENTLEAYALSKWGDDNFQHNTLPSVLIVSNPLSADWHEEGEQVILAREPQRPEPKGRGTIDSTE